VGKVRKISVTGNFKKLAVLLFIVAFLPGIGFHINRTYSYEPGPGEGWATIYVSPAVTSLTSPPYKVGDKITIEVRIHNYSQVASWQVKLVWDARLINITSSNDVDYAPDHIFPAGTYAPIPTAFGKWNATHWYAMKTAATYGAVEYNGVDAGLMRFNFTIMSIPPKGQKYTCTLWLEPTDTWTCDENVEENDEERIDGYYEISAAVANHLEVSPALIVLPEAEGAKIIGEKFSVDILAKNISVTDDIILVQWEMYYNNTVLNCTNIIEGDFMNNPQWAPYGTLFNWVVDKYDSLSRITCFTLINTNLTTGEWDWPERPEGDGKIATIEFEILYQPRAPASVTLPLNLEGVFGEFFINTLIEYVPYGPPLNGTFTLNGYYYQEPVAEFSFTEPVEVNKTVTFNASASYGYRNDAGTLVPDPTYIKEYRWDFGDGNITTTTNPIIYHTYSNPGKYIVNLTVVDYDGLTGSTTKSLWAIEIVTHTVTYETHSFTVVTMSTGKIEKDSIILIQKHRCLHFNVTCQSGVLTIINVTIPNELLSAPPSDWMVIVNGYILTPSHDLFITAIDPEHTMVSMQFTLESVGHVFIFGTSVVPEFPGNSMIYATIIILAIASTITTKLKKRI
jgi:hypothetical protein